MLNIKHGFIDSIHLLFTLFLSFVCCVWSCLSACRMFIDRSASFLCRILWEKQQTSIHNKTWELLKCCDAESKIDNYPTSILVVNFILHALYSFHLWKRLQIDSFKKWSAKKVDGRGLMGKHSSFCNQIKQIEFWMCFCSSTLIYLHVLMIFFYNDSGTFMGSRVLRLLCFFLN